MSASSQEKLTGEPEKPHDQQVLLVDDDPAMLRLLAVCLSAGPYRLVTAASVAGAKLILAREDIAVIVSDLELTDGTGLDLLAEARLTTPDTAGILLTGKGTLQAAVRAINEGSVFRYLTKDCEPAMLDEAVVAALEHHRQRRAVNRQREVTERRTSVLQRLESRFPGILDVPDGVHRRVLGMRRLEQLERIAAEVNLDSVGLLLHAAFSASHSLPVTRR